MVVIAGTVSFSISFIVVFIVISLGVLVSAGVARLVAAGLLLLPWLVRGRTASVLLIGGGVLIVGHDAWFGLVLLPDGCQGVVWLLAWLLAWRLPWVLPSHFVLRLLDLYNLFLGRRSIRIGDIDGWRVHCNIDGWGILRIVLRQRLRYRPVGPWWGDVRVLDFDHYWDHLGLRHCLVNNDPWNLHRTLICSVSTRRWNTLVVAGVDVFVLHNLDVPNFLNCIVLLVGLVLVRVGSFRTVGGLLKGTKGSDVNHVPQNGADELLSGLEESSIGGVGGVWFALEVVLDLFN